MADNQPIMALGEFRFSLGAAQYETLQRTLNITWAKTDIINNRPNYQFSNIGDETITISGAAFNYHANQAISDTPLAQNGADLITLMRTQALLKKPLRLTLNTGETLGYWVINTVSERQSQFIKSAPLKQAFDLSLSYFGDTL